MKSTVLFGLLAISFFLLSSFIRIFFARLETHPTLPIGAGAPDFNLPGTDGKNYSLSSFAGSKILVVIFTCNHCPTAQSYEDRIIRLTADYAAKSVSVVAIMPNDPLALRLDELDFSDLGDSFEDMKARASDKHFNFPYLYDGETQHTASAYGPVSTPHVFVFDRNRKLRYSGRFDDMESHEKIPGKNDTRDAIEALLADKEVIQKTTKVFGCSIKWSEKRQQVQESLASWAKEPVHVSSISETGIRDLLKNNSGKLRLINVWATWCGPCTAEFPELIAINRMYRDRDFELVSLSADDPEKQDRVLKFLVNQEASNQNYLFASADKYRLIEAIDSAWQGALPYTLLVEPGGKIVYSRQGPVDPAELKKTIINNRFMGRYP